MTSTGTPIPMTWHEGAFRPASAHWARRAEKEFKDGDTYRLVDVPERSTAQHNRYFAMVQNAWDSLPPHLQERFPTAEHLRKFCLIQAGYSNSQSITCGSNMEAKKVAAFVRPIDEFSLVTVTGSVVSVYTAQSQNYRAMGKQVFRESADKVLEAVADLIGVTPAELKSSEPTQLQYLQAG